MTTAVRFDEYLRAHAVTATAADRFDAFDVDVVGPPDWEPVDYQPGMRIWVWRKDPNIERFAANAVLTLHRVEATLDPEQAFAMLCEQQLHSVADCQERYRILEPAADNIGVQGLLTSRIGYDLGTLDSVTQTRIVIADAATLIAQLTITALDDSPVDWEHIRLSVLPANTPTAPADPAVTYHGDSPTGPAVATPSGPASTPATDESIRAPRQHPHP